MPINYEQDEDDKNEDDENEDDEYALFEDEDQGNDEEGQGDDEDLSGSSPLLHPSVLPWLRTRLKAPKLGPVTTRLVQEYSSRRYNLDRPINELSGLDQDNLLGDVKIFRRAEQDARNSERAPTGNGSGTPTGVRGNKFTGSSPKMPPSRIEAEQALQAEQALNLLTPQEQEAAKAVSLYLSALLTHSPAVKRWRAQVLQGQLLTASQADTFISSPATRFLTVESWQQQGLSAAAPAANLLAWEVDYVSEEDLPAERKSAAIFSSTTEGQGYYDSYRATLELATPHKTPPDETPLDKTILNKKHLPKKTLTRELLGNEDALLWIPFLALLDVVDPNDASYPRMFPGSVADELRLIGENLSHGMPFQPWQIAWLILTDEAPQLMPVRVKALAPSLKAVQKASVTPEHAFRARLAAGLPAMGYIQIEALPWVSSETIQRYFSHWQKPMRTCFAPYKTKEGKLVYGTTKRYLPALHLLQAIQEEAWTIQQGNSFSWRTLHNSRDAQGRKYTTGYSSFLKGCKAAWTRLNLPWDLEQIIQLLTDNSTQRHEKP